jgi:fructosamine-3-kinase
VPRPICCGESGDHAFLALEWLDFGGGNDRRQGLLGRQLAALHAIRQPHFGWRRDNTIGSTPQINDQTDDWLTFWREKRLGFQLNLAARRGHGGQLQKSGERLLAELAGLFDGYRPFPSLLHGDLWGGNADCTQGGDPVVFDPACYCGDREADVAMTELFGGFSSDFYAGYREILPLDDGYRIRKQLYNLYHVLNHLNLFGSGYRSQAETMIAGLLAELGLA